MSRPGGLLREFGRLGALVPAAAAIAVVGYPLAAQAQQQPAPGRDELERGRDLTPQFGQPSRLRVDGDIERGPCPLADPAYADIKVNFSKVSFGNLEAVPAGTLDSTWSDVAGREVPIAMLCEVRDRAATRLRQMGFLAAVQVPPQRIEKGGEVRMDVLVARLVDVQVRGNPGNAGDLIAAHLRKLTGEQWFNIRNAERHLLLLRDLPGFDVRLTLRPAGGAPGEVVGDVLVERRRVEVFMAAQNLGSIAAGREGGFVQIAVNDLTGLGDRTVFSIYNTFQTREQTVLQAAHDFALGSDGLRLGGKFIYGISRPSIAGANFESRTTIGGIALTYPFVRREALSLHGEAGFELIDQTVDFGATVLSKDKLRVAYARMDLAMIDKASVAGEGGFSIAEPRWQLDAGVELRQGTGIFGGSASCVPVAQCAAPNLPISNVAADPRALLVRFDAVFEYRISRMLSFSAAPRGQYSAKQLLNYEQFSLGNYSIGRGFDAGTLAGDSGIGTSLELRYGHSRPRSQDSFSFQPFAFLDTAWTWTNGGLLPPGSQHLWSAGGGIRARWGDRGTADLTFAVPLAPAGTQTARGDMRVLFTITTRLLPWKSR